MQHITETLYVWNRAYACINPPLGKFCDRIFPFQWMILFYCVQTIPFIFALMSNKQQATYDHLFQYIESNIMSLQAASFMTDYELALRNVLSNRYPTACFYACWFHFTQAVKRHASQINGLMSFIGENCAAKKIYYKFMCLPLLPPNLIESEFRNLKMEAEAINRKRFKKFLFYYENQWILKVIEHTQLFFNHSSFLISYEFDFFSYGFDKSNFVWIFFIVKGRPHENFRIRKGHTNYCSTRSL